MARASSSPTPRRKRPVRAPRSAFLLGSLVALAAALWLSARDRVWQAPADPLLRMTAEQAFNKGLSLGGGGHHLAALPYFRRAVNLEADSWTAHQNYASTLFNGAQEARIHLGKDEPATRSSLERMIMIGESLRQTDEATNWASEPTDRAMVIFQRAQAFHTFGFPLDALMEFRKGTELSPGDAVIARAMNRAEEQLRSGGNP